MTTMKTIGTGVLGVVLGVLSGVAAAGDRAITAVMALCQNEFIMMGGLIAAFLLLLKS